MYAGAACGQTGPVLAWTLLCDQTTTMQPAHVDVYTEKKKCANLTQKVCQKWCLQFWHTYTHVKLLGVSKLHMC